MWSDELTQESGGLVFELMARPPVLEELQWSQFPSSEHDWFIEKVRKGKVRAEKQGNDPACGPNVAQKSVLGRRFAAFGVCLDPDFGLG